LNSGAETSGANVVEQCVAWANATKFGGGDRGGITLIQPRRDVVRESTAFLNGDYGINIRGGRKSSQDEQYKSKMADNLAWGNWCDYKIKTGAAYVHFAERCVGLGPWSLNNGGLSVNCLIGHWNAERTPDNIKLEDEKGLDLHREFADPDNWDFRLQATSRFRAALTNGLDRGPHPFQANIFYVRPDGNDAADGGSISNAWRTLARALQNLQAGDTLYLDPGIYAGDLVVKMRGNAGKTIYIRGRRRDPVVIQGGLDKSDVT